MSLLRIQVTLGAGATPLTTAANRKPMRQMIAEADDGNSDPAFVGDSGVTAANGIRLTPSATVPGRVELGPFSGDAPVNTDEVFFIGTAAELINVLVVTH